MTPAQCAALEPYFDGVAGATRKSRALRSNSALTVALRPRTGEPGSPPRSWVGRGRQLMSSTRASCPPALVAQAFEPARSWWPRRSVCRRTASRW